MLGISEFQDSKTVYREAGSLRKLGIKEVPEDAPDGRPIAIKVGTLKKVLAEIEKESNKEDAAKKGGKK